MKFKDDIVAARFADMHPMAQKIATEMDQYAQNNYGIELTLTETASTKIEDKAVGRVSDTHRTRRAFDVRVRDLPEALIGELCSVFRKKYIIFGAFSHGQKNLIVYRPHGTGRHLHVQLSRLYQLQEIDYGTN